MAKTFKTRLLFDYLDNILAGKSKEIYDKHVEDDLFETEFKKFMVIRYLSMSRDPKVRELAMDNQFELEKLDNRRLYAFLLVNVPKQRSGFIKYIR